MQLVLTEDQELLAKTAADFVGGEVARRALRELRDEGRSRRLLARALEGDGGARLGGDPLPGGASAARTGLAELAVVLEALGATWRRSPSSRPCCSAARRCCSAAAMRSRRVAGCPWSSAGEKVPGPGLPGGAQPLRPAARGDAGRARRRRLALSGEKIQVLDGTVARRVRRGGAHRGRGRRRRRHHALPRTPAGRGADASSASTASTRAAPRSCVRRRRGRPRRRRGRAGAGRRAARARVDGATVGLCAEMLGSMSEAFERTLAVPEGPQAVRRADRQLPGAQAPGGRACSSRSSSAARR